MPKLIPVHTVILHRDGKQVVPPLAPFADRDAACIRLGEI